MLIELPYPVEAQNVRVDDLTVPSEAIVTAGPRVLIDRVSRQIKKHYPDVIIIEPLDFRDHAFPSGGWTLGELMNPDKCAMLRRELDVAYVVLLEVGPHVSPDQERSVSFGLGSSGYDTEKSVLRAIVIDLERPEVVCRLASSASGKELFLVTWVGGYATNPATEPAVLNGLAKLIADFLRDSSVTTRAKITVLAIEKPYLLSQDP